MDNKAMERKLKAGECLDVRKEGELSDGVILASVSSDLYQHEAFNCLFLR